MKSENLGRLHFSKKRHTFELTGKTFVEKGKTLKEKGKPVINISQYLRRSGRR